MIHLVIERIIISVLNVMLLGSLSPGTSRD